MNDMLRAFEDNGCPFLFCVVLLEQAGLPIPAAPCLLAAGALCAGGELHLGKLMGITVLACLLADLAWFYIGRQGGKRILQWLCRFGFATDASAEKIERNFIQHGMSVVALAKFVPGLSVLAPPL